MFDDGNGRIERAIANAELISHGERRIMIPTVYQVEYIDALKRTSQQNDPKLGLRMLDCAQEFTASIDFTDSVDAENNSKHGTHSPQFPSGPNTANWVSASLIIRR